LTRLGNLFSSILEGHAKVWHGTLYTTQVLQDLFYVLLQVLFYLWSLLNTVRKGSSMSIERVQG